MDFFARQDKARQKTTILVFYFLAAVLLIVAAVNLVIWLFVFYFSSHYHMTDSVGLARWITHPACWWTTGITLAVILFGSLQRFLQLRRGGGHALAALMGATFMEPDTSNPRQRQLLNIVEEMAIASGMPVPEVYIMANEPGLNAFVAGYQPTQCVLVVTQGLLDTLNRSEMQGVIGHEFSHILNGDMAINIRLISVLAGILLIGQLGEFLMRSGSRRHYYRRNRNNGQAQQMLIGLAIMVVGYIGLFFGRLIKAAISRQREFLADASSVQFTRDPTGIAEALLKIKHAQYGSRLGNKHAEEMSHLCFGMPVNMAFARLLATHPPLDERIRAIDPGYLARDRARQRQQEKIAANTPTPTTMEGASNFAGDHRDNPIPFQNATGSTASDAGHHPAQGITSRQLVDTVGNPTPAHYAYASQLHATIPEALKQLVRHPAGARALVLGLLAPDGVAFSLHDLENQDPESFQALSQHLNTIKGCDSRLRLPLLDMALPSLKQLDNAGKQQFLSSCRWLIGLDNKTSLFEFVTYTILRLQLSDTASRAPKIRYHSIQPLAQDACCVLSLLCHTTGYPEDQKQGLFALATQPFSFKGNVQLLPINQCHVSNLNKSLEKLNLMPMALKQSFLNACADCVIHDNHIQVAEAELLRAISESLGCPMPPLLAENS